MAVLIEQRRRFTVAAVAMGIVCLLALMYLLTPITSSSAEKQQQLLAKQQQLRTVEEQTRPIQRLPQLVSKAKGDISSFYADRLPAFPTQIYSEIYRLAQKNNVSVSEVKYEAYDTSVNDLKLIQVEAKVSGSYGNLMRFINSVERNKLFFLIDTLQLADTKTRDTNEVQLNIKMETYLRPRGSNEKPSAISSAASDDDEETSE
jgi:type IV pilus assembly protein PilO